MKTKDVWEKFEVLISVHKCKMKLGPYLQVHKITARLDPAVSESMPIKLSGSV